MHHARFGFPSLPFLCGGALLVVALVPAGEARAATRVVANCNNSGAGSLRSAVSSALSGDTIDLSQLSCNRITLTSGEITIPQDSLELVGRSRYALTLDGNTTSRVFSHTGAGTLRVRHLSITNGRFAGQSAFGGCISSTGDVELIRSRLHHCNAVFEGILDPGGGGGGIYALGSVLLSYSAVFANSSLGTGDAGGGAVLAADGVVLYRSQVYDNQGDRGGGIAGQSVSATYSLLHGNMGVSDGGAIYVHGDGNSQGTLMLNKSTLSANRASWSAGIQMSGTTALIIDSTIVDNVAQSFPAGWLGARTRIYNSTIAYNREEPLSQCGGAITASGELLLESTIVAATTCTLGAPRDIWGLPPDRVVGSHNLIGIANVPVPADTIISTDPRLAPLAENGGPTRTRLPLADSPALERGANPLSREYDQRGPGFPRVKGAFPDIGAVER
jgi:hypothetical protein